MVNRVYATKDKRYGTLYKVHKETGRPAKIEDLPKHCIIDNRNELGIQDIDKEHYIKRAKKMINDFLGKEQLEVSMNEYVKVYLNWQKCQVWVKRLFGKNSRGLYHIQI